MDSLKDRTAAVTGGGNGIGAGIARGFARAGANVVVLDIQAEAARETAEGIRKEGGRAIGLGCDVTDEGSLAAAASAAVDEFGAVHVLSNNAGVIVPQGPMSEKTESDWLYVFDVNVHGIVRCVQAFLPILRRQDAAHIVNTASMAGLVSIAEIQVGVYTASKHACVGYSEYLRAELAPEGIGVSVLCPGLVDTELSKTSARNRPARYGGPESPPAPAAGGVPPELYKPPMQPDEVGPIVIDAILANRGYVFTDTTVGPMIEARLQSILADLAAQRGH